MESSTNDTSVPNEENRKEEMEVEEDKETVTEDKNIEPKSSFFSAGHFSAEKEGEESRMVSRRAIGM